MHRLPYVYIQRVLGSMAWKKRKCTKVLDIRADFITYFLGITRLRCLYHGAWISCSVPIRNSSPLIQRTFPI